MQRDPRPIGDTMLLMLAFVVSFVLCVEILLIASVALFSIDVDLSRLTSSLGTSVQIILGAVLGYATGRATKRSGDNGKDGNGGGRG